jgi:hypothetical protein
MQQYRAVPNLFPRGSATRDVMDLSGFRHIAFDFEQKGEASFNAAIKPKSAAFTVRNRWKACGATE